MYKSGQVKWSDEGIMDSQTPDYDHVQGAYLPHSCDAWVIGGVDAIHAMIVDLNAILATRERGAR